MFPGFCHGFADAAALSCFGIVMLYMRLYKRNYTIMARPSLSADALQTFLKRHHIATLQQLKRALGSSATMTVFRKLKALGYRSSYSHRGKYYTLSDLPRFDEAGLWSCRSVWFSRHGNLIQTAQHWVAQSATGLTAADLQAQLHVEVKEALLELYRRRQIDRQQMGGVYVYWARESGQRRNQRLRRQQRDLPGPLSASSLSTASAHELKAAIILFFSLLDEQQRRCYAGLESFKLGHGGDVQVGKFLNVDVHTVSRGRRELFGGQVKRAAVRQAGGGRKPVEKKRRTSSNESLN